MTVMRFSDAANFFEMGVAIEEDRSVQSFGDAYVTIKVQSSDFSGHNDLWIFGTDMAKFCSALVRLERELRGSASVESVSPDELQLKVSSVTSRGHLAVQGKTGYEVRRENSVHWHSVSFGFEIEPSQLSEAVRLPWVGRYAG